MLRLYSLGKTEKIIRDMAPLISSVSADYGVPEALIKAVLFREIKEIDLFDVFADFVVKHPKLSALFRRSDSSTGYGQIFARTAVRALRFAQEKGIVSAEEFGFETLPEENRPEDLRSMWLKLSNSREFNLRLSVLNILSCADEMCGKTDFSGMSEEDLKRTLSRYNANTKRITPYGEETYGCYLKYLKGE